MRQPRRLAVVAVGVVAAACWLAPPAVADDGDNVCPLSMALFCRFLPVAPGGLDGGEDGVIDLTQQLPPANPEEPLAELPPYDPCQRGCV